MAMRSVRKVFLSSLFFWAGIFTSSSIHAEPQFSLEDSVLSFEPGSGSGTAALELTATGVPASDTPALTALKDLDVPSLPGGSLTWSAHELDRDPEATTRTWMLKAEANGLSRDLIQRRYLEFKFGDTPHKLRYELRYEASKSFEWTVVGPPPELALKDTNQAVRLGVQVKGVKATQVALLDASLVETTTKAPTEEGWMLCEHARKSCDGSAFDIDSGKTTAIWLRPKSDAPIIGKFTGKVSVTAAEASEAKTMNLTLYGTTDSHQYFGIGAILLSVTAAWLVAAYLLCRINRSHLLIPVANLNAQCITLQTRLEKVLAQLGCKAPQTTQCLEYLKNSLTESALDRCGFLPRKWAAPDGLGGLDQARYDAFVVRAGGWVRSLEQIVAMGFERGFTLGPTVQEAEEACRRLDHIIRPYEPYKDSMNLLYPPPDLKILTGEIQDALSASIPSSANAAARRAFSDPMSRGAEVLEKLNIEIGSLSLVVWILYAVLTTALGSYILIYDNPGFGAATDYLLCIFWGFGLPIGAQQLKSTTVGDVRSALGITIPVRP